MKGMFFFSERCLSIFTAAILGNISLRLSARYRLDEGFPALLEKGDLLMIGGEGVTGRCVSFTTAERIQ